MWPPDGEPMSCADPPATLSLNVRPPRCPASGPSTAVLVPDWPHTIALSCSGKLLAGVLGPPARLVAAPGLQVPGARAVWKLFRKVQPGHRHLEHWLHLCGGAAGAPAIPRQERGAPAGADH